MGSREMPILMPSLVRTPDRQRRLWREGSRQQTVLRPDHQVAGLQEYATTPGRKWAVETSYLIVQYLIVQ